MSTNYNLSHNMHAHNFVSFQANRWFIKLLFLPVFLAPLTMLSENTGGRTSNEISQFIITFLPKGSFSLCTHNTHQSCCLYNSLCMDMHFSCRGYSGRLWRSVVIAAFAPNKPLLYLSYDSVMPCILLTSMMHAGPVGSTLQPNWFLNNTQGEFLHSACSKGDHQIWSILQQSSCLIRWPQFAHLSTETPHHLYGE